MSLAVVLKYVEHNYGKGELVIKAKFRAHRQNTRSSRGSDLVYIGQEVKWPIARKIDKSDELQLKIYHSNLIARGRFVGQLRISLQGLLDASYLIIQENLTDKKFNLVNAQVQLEIFYSNPQGSQNELNKFDFDYPAYELNSQKRNREFSIAGSESDMEEDNSLFDDFAAIPDSEHFLQSDDMEEDGSESEQSVLLKRERQLQYVPQSLNPTLYNNEDYQVNITIQEAYKLVGLNISPMIEVKVGEQIKKTVTKPSTSSPYYHQQFVFDFKMPTIKFMAQTIHIRAFSMGTNFISKFMSGKLIGEFLIDTKTLYDQPKHAFFQKWAALVDPKDPLSGCKGYVKVDMFVVGKGEYIKRPLEKNKVGEVDNLEANILLPRHMTNVQTQMAEIHVKIYRAEDLPRMNTDIMASVKQAIVGKNSELADPYVEVSFSGHIGETSVKKRSYYPEWNEEIVFTEMFPPYCTRMRLCVRDKNIIKGEIIATHYIDLSQIMMDGPQGFLPTFGPSWINLYGTPRQYTYVNVLNPDNLLNQSLGEGVAYRGRLLIAIKTKLITDTRGYVIGVQKGQTPAIDEKVGGRKENVFLFSAIYEASVIDAKIGKLKKPIHFEMSMGRLGCSLDEDPERTSIADPVLAERAKSWSCNQTPPLCPATYDDCYYHLPIKQEKFCLFTPYAIEDNRPRMFIPNIIDKLVVFLQTELYSAQRKLIMDETHKASRKLRKLMLQFDQRLIYSRNCIKACRGNSLKTLLDKEHSSRVRRDLALMQGKAKQIRCKVTSQNVIHKISECEAIIRRLEELSHDPQHCLPDVFIWMICDSKRVAYTRIPARLIFYSVVEDECGRDAGKIVSIFLKKPGEAGMGQSGWSIQCQLRMYLWCGLMKDISRYYDNIPYGYDEQCFQLQTPPKMITYTDVSCFQLRCYLYMARNVIGSDSTGLSDPFVRILINDHVVCSHVVPNTLNPVWDSLIVVKNIVFCYSNENIKQRVPVIVVELFDADAMDPAAVLGSTSNPDYLGRCFCQSTVHISGDTYTLPRLEFWKIFRGQVPGGEMLAAFEFVETDISTGRLMISTVPSMDNLRRMSCVWDQKLAPKEVANPNRPDNVIRVPDSVRPVLTSYRLEVMMWGVRDVNRVYLLKVNHPIVMVELAGRLLYSDTLDSYKKKPNFDNSLGHIDLYLPEDPRFWPPVFIQCTDQRFFKISVLVGSNVIDNPTIYFKDNRHQDECETLTTISGSVDDFPDSKLVASGLSQPILPIIPKPDMQGRKSTLSLPTNLAPRKESRMNGGAVTDGQVQRKSTVSQDPANIPQANLKEEPVPGGLVKLKKKMDASDEVDWWSRFYQSLIDQESNNANLQVEDNDETRDILEDIKLDFDQEDDDEEEDILDIPEEVATKKKKKKRFRKLKKPSKKDFKKLMKRMNLSKDAKTNFTFEGDDPNIQYSHQINEAVQWVDRIKIYDCALEDVPEFGGFRENFQTFNLLKGIQKEGELPTSRLMGKFKGNFLIYPIDEDDMTDDLDPKGLALFSLLPNNDPIEMIVRIYIVRCIKLNPCDSNGLADPYLVVRLGDNVRSYRSEYIPKTLNPTFGTMVEMEVTFPQSSSLTVQVWDYDRVSPDDLIGETHIDLENRLYSKHRALCGISEVYHTYGYAKWRDQVNPSDMVSQLARHHNIPEPKYEPIFDRVSIAGKEFYANADLDDGSNQLKKSKEPLALEILKNWSTLPFGCPLLPEHVETRPLYLCERPGLVQGQLQLWVDLFYKKLGPPKYAVNIAPRAPQGYELRVIVHNTADVELNDVSMFSKEKSSDIMVKGWMIGADVDIQVTDVHYKSLDGSGMFNWRFVFPFDYLKSEDCITHRRKDTVFAIDEKEERAPCTLYCQVWDADIISSDDFIGSLSFRLSKIPRCAKSAKSCGLFQLDDDWVPKFSLFRNKRVRGWWPFKGKDTKTDQMLCTGKVELELELLTSIEAEQNPVGTGRDAPCPLAAPNRPESSFLKLMNPLTALHYLICVKLRNFLIKLFIILCFLALLVFFIYNVPGYLAKRMVGA